MVRTRGLVLVVVLFAAAMGMQEALAQSAFAGSWSGHYTDNSASSCSCSGSGCSIPSTNVTCTFTAPWTGTVDSQGNFSVTDQAGSYTCNDGTSGSIPGGTAYAEGQIPANGTLSYPASNDSSTTSGCTFTTSCNPYTIQFTGSSVNGTLTCTSTSTCSYSDTSGSYSITCNGQDTEQFTGSKGSGSTVLTPPQPVFPMQVNSNIGTTATVTAQVSPPAALVGTSGSVFVFAHVRQSQLGKSAADQPATSKDGPTPDPCVLAQVSSSGQLTAVSASSVAPYSSGVLSSQSQSVNVLNNVPTSNVTGASMFVGYGSNSSSMISNGTYQGAVTVGSDPNGCSAALLAGAAPNSPGALSGLWYNASESGWGISFTQRRNIVFGAWYTYDGAGQAKWYVANSCAMPSGVTGTSGTCNGGLLQVSGPQFFGTQFDSSRLQIATVGNLSVNYTGKDNATMSYTVNGQSRTIPITRQLFAGGALPPAVDYTDLWYNPNESGWGMAITQQFGVMFIAWYVYNNNGNPVWYVANACVVVGSTCSGSLLSVTGPPFGPTFDSNAVRVATVGTINVNFVDANNAAVTYTVNGVSGSKAITRQTF